jgi:hypothetical protein
MAKGREREREESTSSAGFERRTYSPTHGFADPSNPPQGGSGVPPKPASGVPPAPSESQPERPGRSAG